MLAFIIIPSIFYKLLLYQIPYQQVFIRSVFKWDLICVILYRTLALGMVRSSIKMFYSLSINFGNCLKILSQSILFRALNCSAFLHWSTSLKTMIGYIQINLEKYATNSTLNYDVLKSVGNIVRSIFHKQNHITLSCLRGEAERFLSIASTNF